MFSKATGVAAGMAAVLVMVISGGTVASAQASQARAVSFVVGSASNSMATISVNARNTGSGTAATGTFTSTGNLLPLGGLAAFRFSGPVTCLDVRGNRAGLIYPITSAGGPLAQHAQGQAIMVTIQDNGPRQPTQVGFVGPAPLNNLSSCPPSVTFLSSTSGHIVIHDARSARAIGANTFSGSCQLTGSVTFQPPLTNEPQSVRQHARANGTCSGTFTDAYGATHHLSSSPASYQAAELANNATCGAGTDSGSGVLHFTPGEIHFSISETRAGPLVTATAQGANGGSAAGQGNVSPSENPINVLQSCAGTGLAQAPIDIRLTTTPSISG